jgi:hypothetical protein
MHDTAVSGVLFARVSGAITQLTASNSCADMS